MSCLEIELHVFFSIREAKLRKHAAEDPCPYRSFYCFLESNCAVGPCIFFEHFVCVKISNVYLEHIECVGYLIRH
jgi:hypothetical protein